jgi:carboxyl-terminal processing protease
MIAFRLAQRVAAAVVLTATVLGAHPTPESAQAAYNYVEAMRAKGRQLWQAKNPEGIKNLHELLHYLDQPLLLDLAKGNLDLKKRRTNIYYELAIAHATLGEPGEMYRALEWLAKNDPEIGLRQAIQNHDAFAAVRKEERFQKILSAFNQESFWESKGLKTPYRENLPAAEKVAGLSKLWSEVKYNFVYIDKLRALDWDKQYLDYIPKVLATNSTAEYYKVLRLFCAMLEDGHTGIVSPAEVTALGLPVRTALVEGKVFITGVLSPTLRRQGLEVGTEIVTIDGVPAVEYGKSQIMPYVSSSTPQDREQRTYGYELLTGPPASSVVLGLRTPSDAMSTVTLERRPYTDVEGTPAFSSKTLPGNIAYVSLGSFGSDQAARDFEQAFDSLAKSAGMIIDVRSNGGGSSGVGWQILSMLTAKPFLTGRYVYRSYVPTYRAWGIELDWIETVGQPFEPHGSKLYTNPVVVLSGPRTFSAAEDFLVAFENMKRGPIIGEPSGGSTGQPLNFSLPGGGSARVCTKKDTHPDGREWVGKGIQPAKLVRPTAADVRSGHDTVLEAAIEHLTQTLSAN